jgi:hypothetical protein
MGDVQQKGTTMIDLEDLVVWTNEDRRKVRVRGRRCTLYGRDEAWCDPYGAAYSEWNEAFIQIPAFRALATGDGPLARTIRQSFPDRDFFEEAEEGG